MAKARRIQDGATRDADQRSRRRRFHAGSNSAVNSAAGLPRSSETSSFGFTSLLNVSRSLSRHYLSQRFSSFSSAAHDGPLHPALVWRRTGGLDQLPAVLPGLPAGWLCIRALAGVASGVRRQVTCTSRYWPRRCCYFQSRRTPRLEAWFKRRSDRRSAAPHPTSSHGYSGRSLSVVVRHGASAAALVHARR